MAKKSGLNRFLELIGLVDESEENENLSEMPRQRPNTNSTYDEPHYTPRKRTSTSVRTDERAYSQSASDRRYSANDRRRYEPAPTASRARRNPYDEDEYPQRPDTPETQSRAMKPCSSTMVYYLHSLSECGDVIQDLIYGKSVLLNLEDTDNVLTQRIVDTLAGATFALKAKIRKISEKMYLIAPENVEVNMTRSVERRY